MGGLFSKPKRGLEMIIGGVAVWAAWESSRRWRRHSGMLGIEQTSVVLQVGLQGRKSGMQSGN